MNEQKSDSTVEPIQTCEGCNRSMLAVYLDDGYCYRCRR
jgi:hypothetical protein